MASRCLFPRESARASRNIRAGLDGSAARADRHAASAPEGSTPPDPGSVRPSARGASSGPLESCAHSGPGACGPAASAEKPATAITKKNGAISSMTRMCAISLWYRNRCSPARCQNAQLPVNTRIFRLRGRGIRSCKRRSQVVQRIAVPALALLYGCGRRARIGWASCIEARLINRARECPMSATAHLPQIAKIASVAKAAAYETITAAPASPHIGAEIGAVDLTRPLANKQVEELHDAFARYQVLFFRDQNISFEDQIRVAGYFGRLGKHVGKSTISKTTDSPYVRKFHYDGSSKQISGENFHSDQSCAAIPPLGTMLYNHTVPPDGGGDTMFASMYAAYEALSDRMKEYLEGLTATHDGTRVFGPGTPVTVHPVITRHPVTGRKVIFVNQDFTAHINGLQRLEGERMLQFLIDHCNKPEWTCRFRWTPHSIAFWDNRCTHHKAVWDYWPNVRSGYRVQLEGTDPPTAG